MKRTIFIIMSLLVVGSLIACSSATATEAASAAAEAPAEEAAVEEAAEPAEEAAAAPTEEPAEAKNYAFFIVHENNEFMASLADAVEQAAADAGVNVEVYSADSDPAKQISQVESVLAQGIDGVMIDPASYDGITAAIDACLAAEVPVITFHESVSVQDQVASYVGINLELIGESSMKQVMEDLGGKGKIAVMYGALGNSAQIAISDGFDKVLADYPDVEVVFDGTANWTQDEALELAENWLSTGKQIDAIVCQNDGMALGALQAVKSAGKVGEIKLYGNDGVTQVIEAIKAGEITATIYTDAQGEAVKGIEVLNMLTSGETVDPEYIIPPLVITADNVGEYFD